MSQKITDVAGKKQRTRTDPSGTNSEKKKTMLVKLGNKRVKLEAIFNLGGQRFSEQ